MLGAASIAHHAVEAAGLLKDLVDGGLDGGFLGHVGLECEDAVGEFCGHGGEFVACVADVDGVDCCGAVGEAAVCYSEADACGYLLV